MNEVIGAKGSSNDRRRSFLISYKLLKKLKLRKQLEKQRKLKELEKKVKKLQIITFFKATPLIIPTSILEILFKKKKTNKKSNIKLNKIEKAINKEENKKDKIKQIKASNKEIKIIKPISIIKFNKKSTNVDEITKNNIQTLEKANKNIKAIPVLNVIKEKKQPQTIIKDNSSKKDNNKDEIKQNIIINEEEKIEKEVSKIIDSIVVDIKEIIDDEDYTESNEIIEEINKEENKDNIADKYISYLNEILDNLDKLSILIKSSDVGYSSYYNLIDKYTNGIEINMSSFNSKQYKTAKDKLDKIYYKKDLLEYNLSLKSTKANNRESNDLFKYKKLNKDIDKLKEKKEEILDKVKKEVKVKNRFIINRIKYITIMSASLLTVVLGTKNIKRFTIASYIAVNQIKNMINDKEEEIDKDSIIELQNSIKDTNSILLLLNNTSYEVDILITRIKSEYSDYLDECSELINSLYSIKKELKSKKKEIINTYKEKEKINKKLKK